MYIPVRHGSPKNEKCLNMKIDFSLPISIRFFFHLQAPVYFIPKSIFLSTELIELCACLRNHMRLSHASKNKRIPSLPIVFVLIGLKTTPPPSLVNYFNLKLSPIHTCMHVCIKGERDGV